MAALLQKKILFIGPVFYDYHTRIADALRSHGAEITFIPEREYDFTYKSLHYINKRLARQYSNRHFMKKIRNVTDKGMYDYVFIIHGENLTQGMMKQLRTDFHAARFINYHWDSLKFNHGATLIMDFFDKVYSFDRKDVERNHGIWYKPLFHNYEGKPVAVEPQHDILFIGVDYSDRFAILLQISEQAKSMGLRYKSILITSKFSYYRKKLFGGKAYQSARKSDFTFGKVPYQEYLRLTNASKAIIDINFDGQAGLTMRTIEVMAMGKKLITTNPNIRLEPFYSSSNVLTIDRKNPVIPCEFLETVPLPVDVSYLLLRNWVLEFFE